jgi:hypothetical protein
VPDRREIAPPRTPLRRYDSPHLRQAVPAQSTFRLPSRRLNLATTYSASDIVAVALVAAVVALWSKAAGGASWFLALVACEAVFFAFYLVGSLFAGWRRLAEEVLFDLPLRLLMGYAAVNSALFVLAWLSPLGIIASFGIVLAVAAGLFVATRPVRDRGPSASAAGIIALGISLAAATLWCRDSIHPTAVEGDTMVFQPWIDGFYHAVHLRIFGAGHGAASIEDFRLAGVPARLYHYGCYLTPALIKQISGIASYAAFAGILSPVGVFFTGLGAYALFGSIWGRWPGLAACGALMLLPDGAEQGMRNTFMSYHWLTQISPSANYGLALVALAWLFVLRGCVSGNRLQVIAGWLVGGLLVFYKAHFFIASALLLLLVPPVFFRATLGLRKRVLWTVTAAAAYLVTIVCVRNVSGVPLTRFDGSGLRMLLGHVGRFTQPGALRDFMIERLGMQGSLRSNILAGLPFVLFATLGLFIPLLIVLAIRLRKGTPALFVLFPFIIVANFIAMFTGLALDMRSSTPEELSHRPVILVYFVVVAWVGAAAGRSLFESRRLDRIARPAVVGVAVALMAVPAFLGVGIHRLWALPSLSPPLHIPMGMVKAAQYMRDHGSPQDLFQHSGFDRFCTVAALSERRPFVARSQTRIGHNVNLVEERVAAIQRFMSLRDANTIAAAARNFGFRWFLVDPVDQVDWPEEIASRPVFESGGYRLYQF